MGLWHSQAVLLICTNVVYFAPYFGKKEEMRLEKQTRSNRFSLSASQMGKVSL